jgi:hypothetical protein
MEMRVEEEGAGACSELGVGQVWWIPARAQRRECGYPIRIEKKRKPRVHLIAGLPVPWTFIVDGRTRDPRICRTDWRSDDQPFLLCCGNTFFWFTPTRVGPFPCSAFRGEGFNTGHQQMTDRRDEVRAVLTAYLGKHRRHRHMFRDSPGFDGLRD